MPGSLHPRRLLVALAVAALVIGACSDGGDDDGAAQPTATTSASTPGSTESSTPAGPGTEATPQPSLRQAVEGLLAAEVDADPAASYRFLGEPAREEYRDVAEWTRRRSQLPVTSGFEIEEPEDDDTVVAVVTHPPGLDPFIGLSPARERHTFTGVEVDGGWLVESEPEVEFLLPPDDEIAQAVRDWGAAVQACDEAAAGELEAVDEVFGVSVGASELCDSTGEVEVGEVTELLAGPQSTDLIAQYSTDILAWARVLPVTGPVTPFSVVVAPIGDDWRVLAVAD